MSYLGRSAKLTRKTQEKVSFLATAGQTTKTGLSYVSTFVEVRVNGIILTDVLDYTATDGNSITFPTALSLNDEVTVISLKTFALADHYNKTEADAQFSTPADVTTAVSALADSAPAALDTLNELASALGDDPNFATTVNANIATKLPKSGGTMTGDTLHGDSVKAKFGTGGDLEIYHDGSDSYVKDSGTGNLLLQGTNLNLQSTTTDDYIRCTAGSDVKIYHNDSEKLATTSTGIDVTGTVTADGLVVDGGNVTISDGYIRTSGNGSAASPSIQPGYDDDSGLYRQSSNVLGVSTGGKRRLLLGSNGDISFYEDTGTTPKFFWDASAESLGIGTVSPSSRLTVEGTSNATSAIGAQYGAQTPVVMGQYSSGDGHIDAPSGKNLRFYGGTAERMRIDSSGNVLVGTTLSDVGWWYNRKGVVAKESGQLHAAAYSIPAAVFNRNTNDGDIVEFRKAGSKVGSVGTIGGDLILETGDVGIRLYNGGQNILPVGSGGLSRDNAISLGQSNIRWKDAYLSGGVYLGGTGAANKLEDYEEGTFTPVVADASSGGNVASVGTKVGFYTKIGRLVNVSIQLANINTTGLTSTGQLYIRGFPYASASTSAHYADGVCRLHGFDISNTRSSVTATMTNSDSWCRLFEWGDGTSDAPILVGAVINSASDAYISITYMTD